MAPYLDALAAGLEAQEYSRKSIRRQLRNADSFGSWLDHQKLSLAAITGQIVSRYINGLHRSARAGYAKGYTPHNARGLARLLDLLPISGVLPTARPPGIDARGTIVRHLPPSFRDAVAGVPALSCQSRNASCQSRARHTALPA
jgi:hypothetical protein